MKRSKRTSWNKGLKGVQKPYWLGKKRPDIGIYQKGSNNPLWAGDEVSYSALHEWVRKWKGTPKKCEMCGTETASMYEWANIDHQYRRVLDDFIRLCRKCHYHYDRD